MVQQSNMAAISERTQSSISDKKPRKATRGKHTGSKNTKQDSNMDLSVTQKSSGKGDDYVNWSSVDSAFRNITRPKSPESIGVDTAYTQNTSNMSNVLTFEASVSTTMKGPSKEKKSKTNEAKKNKDGKTEPEKPVEDTPAVSKKAIAEMKDFVKTEHRPLVKTTHGKDQKSKKKACGNAVLYPHVELAFQRVSQLKKPYKVKRTMPQEGNESPETTQPSKSEVSKTMQRSRPTANQLIIAKDKAASKIKSKQSRQEPDASRNNMRLPEIKGTPVQPKVVGKHNSSGKTEHNMFSVKCLEQSVDQASLSDTQSSADINMYDKFSGDVSAEMFNRFVSTSNSKRKPTRKGCGKAALARKAEQAHLKKRSQNVDSSLSETQNSISGMRWSRQNSCIDSMSTESPDFQAWVQAEPSGTNSYETWPFASKTDVFTSQTDISTLAKTQNETIRNDVIIQEWKENRDNQKKCENVAKKKDKSVQEENEAVKNGGTKVEKCDNAKTAGKSSDNDATSGLTRSELTEMNDFVQTEQSPLSNKRDQTKKKPCGKCCVIL